MIHEAVSKKDVPMDIVLLANMVGWMIIHGLAL